LASRKPGQTTAKLARISARRQVGRLAGPFVLANLGQPIMGIVDTVLSGHLDDPALIGAVGVGSLLLSYLFWVFGFLRLATGGYTAQARGAGDSAEVRAVLARSLLLAFALAALVLLVQGPVSRFGIDVIGASEDVSAGAALYFGIRIWAAPASLALYCLHGWLLGMRDARSVMVLTLSLHGLNAGFSCLFVLGLDYGLAGVAAGTLVAEYLAAGLGCLLILAHLRRHRARIGLDRLLDPSKLTGLFAANLNLMVRTFALMTGTAIFTSAGAALGDRILAANQLLLQLVALTSYAIDAFADSAEALVGAAKGSGSRRRAGRMIRASMELGVVAALGFALVFLLLGGEILGLFTKHEAVVLEAVRFLPWVSSLPLVSVWCYVLDGVFVGTTRTAALRNAMLASLALFWAAEALLVPIWANHGLWAAFLLFFSARGVSLSFALPHLLRGIARGPGAAPTSA